MRELSAYNLANEMMSKHGLRGWKFSFNDAKTTFGMCRFDTKTIFLSLPITLLNPKKEVLDTILHEIAHALAGHRAENHGKRWKEIARSIGCRAKACFDSFKVKTPDAPWEARCEGCGHVAKRYRKPSRRAEACMHCCSVFNKGKFMREYRLRYKKNRKLLKDR